MTHIDPIRIEQVLVNLLDNAIKYSPKGGRIELTAETTESTESILISVRDYGVGISEEHLRHIFERFYRARSQERIAGIGLGLYISKQIIELHGGYITVDAPKDGGSRFTIALPRERKVRLSA